LSRDCTACNKQTNKCKNLFPFFELESVDEPDRIVDKLHTNVGEEATAEDGLDEDIEESKVEVDDAFLHFEKRVARMPQQVLR
jgi:hypothetical protein